MQKPTLCMVCERKPGVYTCSMCGRVVCSEHYDASTGMCTACRLRKTR
ncbi:MAG TPA: hypothetical protein VJC00_01475 [Candidatus Nanoarchaeia archaeon]|nr:hypothetical protein [Candidatus Nanoarchaeia archaeon]